MLLKFAFAIFCAALFSIAGSGSAAADERYTIITFQGGEADAQAACVAAFHGASNCDVIGVREGFEQQQAIDNAITKGSDNLGIAILPIDDVAVQAIKQAHQRGVHIVPFDWTLPSFGNDADATVQTDRGQLGFDLGALAKAATPRGGKICLLPSANGSSIASGSDPDFLAGMRAGFGGQDGGGMGPLPNSGNWTAVSGCTTAKNMDEALHAASEEFQVAGFIALSQRITVPQDALGGMNPAALVGIGDGPAQLERLKDGTSAGQVAFPDDALLGANALRILAAIHGGQNIDPALESVKPKCGKPCSSHGCQVAPFSEQQCPSCSSHGCMVAP